MSNINENVTAIKPISSYTKEALKNIQLLSFNKDILALPFGSYAYKIQKYPGDIDLIEKFIRCCSKKEVLDALEKRINETVQEILNERNHYITEFKIGLDERYIVDIGQLKNGHYNINKNNIERKLKNLSDNNLISIQDTKEIRKILKKKNHDANDYDIIYNIFRKYRVLRWTKKDLLNKYIILPGNIKMTLRQALEFKTPVKIDVIALINNRFIEITNFLLIAYKDKKGRLIAVNLPQEQYSKETFGRLVIDQLRDEIEKLLYSKYYFNPFKAVKRMWALSRFIKKNDVLEKLLPIISGDLSLLYQIKSDIDAILTMFKKFGNVPKKSIAHELDLIKDRLSRVVEIDNDLEAVFDNQINRFDEASKKNKILILEHLKERIQEMVDENTINYLKNNKLLPPPRDLLPDQLRYIKDDIRRRRLI